MTASRGENSIPLRRFAVEHWSAATLSELSAESQARWQSDLYRDTGGLVPARVERSSEAELSLLVRAQAIGEWLRVSVAVGPEPPHLIERFGVFFLAPWEPPVRLECAHGLARREDAGVPSPR